MRIKVDPPITEFTGSRQEALKNKTEASLPPPLFSSDQLRGLCQPSRRMGQQGINKPGLRGEMAA
jgi:hypothetical protein